MMTEQITNCTVQKYRAYRRRALSTQHQARHFGGSEQSAVSNIVTSIMMMGIIFTLLGMILTVYVPIWAKSMEATHMEEVGNAFVDIKSTVDSQIAQGDVGTKQSTRVRLGTEGGPLLGLGQSTGGLSFAPAESMMRVYNTNDMFEKYGTGRGRLRFESHNLNYVDQEYIFENGAVILNQMGSTLMKVEPNLYVNNVSETNTISIVCITLQGDIDNIGGIKSQPVQTTLLSVNKDTVEWGEGAVPGSGRNITLSINTSYPTVWHEYFKDLLGNRSGLSSDEYSVAEPVQKTVDSRKYWTIEMTVLDVNRFTTTLAYVDTMVG